MVRVAVRVIDVVSNRFDASHAIAEWRRPFAGPVN